MRKIVLRMLMQHTRLYVFVLLCMGIIFVYGAEYGADNNAQIAHSSVSLETVKQSLERICALDNQCSDSVALLLEQIKAQLAEHPDYISIDKQCSCEAYIQAMDTLQNNHDAITRDTELQELVSAISVLDVKEQIEVNTQEDRAVRPTLGTLGTPPLATTSEIVDMPKDITVERDLMVGGNQRVQGSVTIIGAITATSSITLNNQNELRLADAPSSNYVGFRAPAVVPADVIWTLPAADGAAGNVLTTNASGTLSWSAGGGSGSGAVVSGGLGKLAIYSTSPVGTTVADSVTLGGKTAQVAIATPAGNSVFTIPNVGDSDFVMTEGSQSIAGTKTFTGNMVIPDSTTTAGIVYKGSTAAGDRFISNLRLTNTFIGKGSGNLTITGIDNTTIGSIAGAGLSMGSYNTFVGKDSGRSMFNDVYNIIIGASSGGSLSSGIHNIFVGYAAGGTISSGSNNVLIGSNAGSGYSGTVTNTIVIGTGVTGSGAESNVIRIGNSSHLSMYLPTGITIDTPTPGTIAFASDVVIANSAANTPGQLRLVEGSTGGINYIALQAPSILGSDLVLTLPSTAGSVGNVLTTNGAGTLSWASGAAAGTIASGTLGNLAIYSADPTGLMIADSASINAKTVQITIAEPSAGGRVYTIPDTLANSSFVMTAADQIIGGDKRFTGDIILEKSVGNPSTAGVIYTSGSKTSDTNRFISNPGTFNTFIGESSGNLGISGSNNVGIGYRAGTAITTGNNNTLIGAFNGSDITTGDNNTLFGYLLGYALTTGTDNIMIGHNGSGINGSRKIIIGTAAPGFATSNEIKLGNTQTKCFIAGIAGASPTLPTANVIINSSKQLGSATPSSIRYKKDITPMGVDSEKILALEPVAFVYKNDATSTKQYGVIAEQAYQVCPEMVVLYDEGQPDAIQMPSNFTWLLLNEIQKNHKLAAQQQAIIDALQKRFVEYKGTIAALEARLSTLEGAHI